MVWKTHFSYVHTHTHTTHHTPHTTHHTTPHHTTPHHITPHHTTSHRHTVSSAEPSPPPSTQSSPHPGFHGEATARSIDTTISEDSQVGMFEFRNCLSVCLIFSVCFLFVCLFVLFVCLFVYFVLFVCFVCLFCLFVCLSHLALCLCILSFCLFNLPFQNIHTVVEMLCLSALDYTFFLLTTYLQY